MSRRFLSYLTLSILLNTALKIVVNDRRPTENCGENYGWPSGHSQFASFLGTYLLLNVNSDIPILIAVTTGVSYTMYSRLYMGCHTLFQVISGAVFGIVLGYLV
jgi:membrane-associated phospholipid phosphatase